MAITFPITGVTNTFSASRSPSFTLGTSPVENDIIVAYVSSTTTSATTDVSGWTNVRGANTVTMPADSVCAAVMVYHRVTSGEDTADTVTWTLTNLWNANETGRISVAVLRGVPTTSELVGVASGSDEGLVDGTIPSVTPTTDATIIAGFNQDGTGTRTSAPTGYTDIAGGTGTQHNYIYRRTSDASRDTATGTAAANTSTNDEYVSIVAAFWNGNSAGTVAVTDGADTPSVSLWHTSTRSNEVTESTDSGASSSTGSIAVVDDPDATSVALWITSARSNEATESTESDTENSTGTIAATDARDTGAVAGVQWSTGTTAVTDSRDTAALAGVQWSTGTIAATDDADTAVIRDVSVIVAENQLPGEGTSSRYSLTGDVGSTSNLGYARATSVDAGETIDFAVDGDCEVITIYRVGHYDGDNWREVAEIANTPTDQGNETTITDSNGATTVVGWTDTASWTVPSTAVSGLYVAVIRNAAETTKSWIVFVVRNDDRVADIVVGINTSTWGAAYNNYGGPSVGIGEGKSVYGQGSYDTGNGFTIEQRAYAVSFDRPVISRVRPNHWDTYEAPLIDWLEENGYDVKYVDSVDLEARPTAWNDAKIYISVGHDEYWSQGMRDNVEAFRDAGGHCLFMSANEVFWRIRFADDYRTIWCFKDTMPGPGSHTAGDELDPVSWTGTWRDTRRPGGAEPENLLTGTFFRMNGPRYEDPVVSTATYGDSPFWRGTSVETTNLTLTDIVGFEADEVEIPSDGRQSVLLASATININGDYANDNGQTYNNNGSLDPWGIVMHQRAASEGVVVGFGTCGWSWALSDFHTLVGNRKLVAAQQATVNLLVDLGAEPQSLRTSDLDLPTPVAIEAYGIEWETTGTVAVTDDPDTLASTSWLTSARSNEAVESTDAGATPSTGTIAVTDGGDTATVTVVRWSTGTTAATDARDTGAFVAVQWSTGSIAVTDDADTGAAVGVFTSPGNLAATDGTDNGAFVAAYVTPGVLVATDGADIGSFTVVQWSTGAIAATDGGDVGVLASFQISAGIIAVTDSPDEATASGSVPAIGGLGAVDGADTSAFVAAVTISGSVSATDATDTGVFSSVQASVGAAASTDGQDTATISGVMSIVGSLVATDGSDVGALAGTIASLGAISVTDGRDTGVIVVERWSTGSIAATDGRDAASWFELDPFLPGGASMSFAVSAGAAMSLVPTADAEMTFEPA